MNSIKIFGLSIYQLILLAVSLSFIIDKTSRFLRKERNQTLLKLAFTVFVWGSILVFSVFPNLTHVLSENLGFGDNLNTLIFIGFFITFSAIFKMINMIEQIEKNISEIVRKEALDKLDTKK